MRRADLSTAISVVIPTNGRADALRRALQGLAHLDHGDFEVIVVVGPDDAGVAAVRAEAPGEVRWLSCPERNVSMSRNIGIAAAAGDLVAFLDDDAVPEAWWLSELEAAFCEPEVAAAGGPVLDHTGARWQAYFAVVSRAGTATSYTRGRLPGGALSSPESWVVPYAVGTNACFRRTALVRAGGFDEHYTYCYEDADICLRLCDLGYRVATLGDAVVHHGFLPNALRDETRVLRDWSPLFSALFYFASRHGHLAGAVARTWEEVAGVVGRAREWHTRLAEAGVVDPAAPARFEEALRRESEVAFRAAVTAHEVGTVGWLHRHPAATGAAQRFPSLGARLAGRRRAHVCLLAGLGDADRAGPEARARALVDDRGAIVRVISATGVEPRVTFDDGIWWHDVPGGGDPAAAALAELARVHAARPVDAWDSVLHGPIADAAARANLTLRLPAHGHMPAAVPPGAAEHGA
jgi:glycosyltransferase involved in cell wall biosynthesis